MQELIKSIIRAKMTKTHFLKRPSGGRLYIRPKLVEKCKTCGAPTGRNYIHCKECYYSVENIWLMDWNHLLNKENIIPESDNEKLLAQELFKKMNNYPWTLIDTAMTIIRCNTCRSEVGGGPKECPECSTAFGNLWAYDVEAMYQGQMTGNEHAVRVGRWVLRYPHRQKDNIVKSWKFSIPILLTGKVPTNTQGQFFKRMIDENKFDLSNKIYNSFEEAYEDTLKHL